MECEPRILVVPPHARSAGKAITAIAAKAGIQLDETQQLVAESTGGVGSDGRWAAFEAVCFQPRQNGKTEFLLARILAGLYLFGEELIVFSAHRASTTTKAFKRLKRAIDTNEELGARIARVSNRIGSESIELTTGQAVEMVARSTSTGRGFSGDAVIMDEAHELDSEQLAAILPMLSTRPNPQVLYALSQGNEQSTHLGQLRARALSRQDPRVAWVEWSLAEGDRVDDRAVWLRCNPAMAAGRISLEYVEQEFRALGPHLFAVERLGKSSWPQDDTGRFGVVSREAWFSCQAPVGADPRDGGKVSFGLAVSRDGRSGAIVACGAGADGLPLVAVVDHRPGDGCGWMVPRLAVLTGKYDTAAVCWDPASLAGPLGLANSAGRGTEVIEPKPGELAQACAGFMFSFEDRAARHTGSVELTQAVGAARIRPSRSAWYFDDRGFGAEVLQAAVWAMHAHTVSEPYDLLASVAGSAAPERVPYILADRAGQDIRRPPYLYPLAYSPVAEADPVTAGEGERPEAVSAGWRWTKAGASPAS